MNSYTVVQPPWVDDQLAELWLESRSGPAFKSASDWLYEELREDAEIKGEVVEGNLRKIAKGPLWIYNTVRPADCLVTVWSVRKAKR